MDKPKDKNKDMNIIFMKKKAAVQNELSAADVASLVDQIIVKNKKALLALSKC